MNEDKINFTSGTYDFSVDILNRIKCIEGDLNIISISEYV